MQSDSPQTTDTQLAFIKLAAFRAVVGWGTSKTDKIGDIEVPRHVPWDWQTCLDRADELTIWALTDPRIDEIENVQI